MTDERLRMFLHPDGTPIVPLKWNDPDPIPGADYTITSAIWHGQKGLNDEPIGEIEFGSNSFAEVFTRELFNDELIWDIKFGCESFAEVFAREISFANPRGMTKKRYEEIAMAYNTAASKVGLTGNQLQAVTWTVWRELENDDFKLKHVQNN